MLDSSQKVEFQITRRKEMEKGNNKLIVKPKSEIYLKFETFYIFVRLKF
ncbi:hypothetical protein EMIT07CA2_40466 [Brevibacillus sp. IT-7CA2]